MRATLTVLIVPVALALLAGCGDARGAQPAPPPPGTPTATAEPVAGGPQGCDPTAALARPTNVPDEAWAPPTHSTDAAGRAPFTEEQAVERALARGGHAGEDVQADATLGPLGQVPLDPAPQGAPERCVYTVTVAAPLVGPGATTTGATASGSGGYTVVLDYLTGDILGAQAR